MKKKIVIISAIVITLCSIFFIIYNCNDQFRFKLSYEYINLVDYNNGKKIKVNIPFNNHIKYLKDDEIISFLTKETGVIYFGYNTCPWCRNIIEPLLEVIDNNKVDKLYYVDAKKSLKSISSKLLKALDSTIEENENGNKGLGVPVVYFIKDGQIMDYHVGTVNGYNNPYKGMNKKQKEELKEIYQKGIEAIR